MAIAGWPPEAVRFLTGAPSDHYDISEHSSDYIWSLIYNADVANCIITATTDTDETETDSEEVGIEDGHAYTIMSAIPIYNTDGSLKANLLKMRNPWGDDGDYNATWNDDDSIWNTTGETYAI